MAKKLPSKISVAALSVALAVQGAEVPTEFRLIPAGPFQSWDGRPGKGLSWVLSDNQAAVIVSAALARQSDYVIDFEHQTLFKRENGQKAPASGWFKDLEWRPGDGLYAVNVRWTAEAAADIAALKYRYISPVFAYDEKTGAVLAIRMAALTNDPGLDGLGDLSQAALSALLSDQPQESAMDELLEQLRWLLNLPVGATAEDTIAQLQKLIDQLKAGPAQAAASFDLAAYLAEFKSTTASLSAVTALPDPAKFVSIATLSAVQGELTQANAELAELRSEKTGQEVDRVVTEALTAGKLTPATEAWARDLGKKDMAALTAYLSAVAPVVVPGATQTGGKSVSGTGSAQHTDVDLAVMTALGLSAEQYAAGKMEA